MKNKGEMQSNSYRRRPTRRFLLFGLIAAILFVVGGYFLVNKLLLNPDQAKEKVVKHILNDQFTVADVTLIKLLESPDNASVIGNGKSSTPQGGTELEGYLEQEYKSYFTEEMYENYITTYLFTYQVPAVYSDIQLDANEITLKQNNESDGLYDFTVLVSYEGNEEAEVAGRARVNNDEKITYFEILNDDGLSKKLSDVN